MHDFIKTIEELGGETHQGFKVVSLKRFVSRIKEDGPCLVFQHSGKSKRASIGIKRADGSQATLDAPRITMRLVHGDDAVLGKSVVNACGNKACCNPDHILIVDHALSADTDDAVDALVKALKLESVRDANLAERRKPVKPHPSMTAPRSLAPKENGQAKKVSHASGGHALEDALGLLKSTLTIVSTLLDRGDVYTRDQLDAIVMSDDFIKVFGDLTDPKGADDPDIIKQHILSAVEQALQTASKENTPSRGDRMDDIVTELPMSAIHDRVKNGTRLKIPDRAAYLYEESTEHKATKSKGPCKLCYKTIKKGHVYVRRDRAMAHKECVETHLVRKGH
jgi:hypothetical protein